MTFSDFAPERLDRGGNVSYGGDENLIAEFYWREVLNKPATEYEGRPIYNQKEYIHILIPADKTTDIHRPVKESDKQRWPRQYEAFKAQEEQVLDGTPLSEWTILTVAQRAEMKAMGFRTVENIAAMSDQQMDRIGMGARKIKTMAQAYLDQAREGVSAAKYANDIEKRDNEISTLKAQVDQLAKRLEEVLRTSQPVETESSPMVEANTHEQDIGGSSLAAFGDDDLPEPVPVKKRGRPKKEAAE